MKKLHKELGEDILSIIFFLIIVFFVFKIIVWAWHIHWLFGFLMFLFLLGGL